MFWIRFTTDKLIELEPQEEGSDDGVGALARTGSELTVLKFLQLDQISDRGVVGLRQLSKLRRLQIEGCKHVSESAIGGASEGAS